MLAPPLRPRMLQALRLLDPPSLRSVMGKLYQWSMRDTMLMICSQPQAPTSTAAPATFTGAAAPLQKNLIGGLAAVALGAAAAL